MTGVSRAAKSGFPVARDLKIHRKGIKFTSGLHSSKLHS